MLAFRRILAVMEMAILPFAIVGAQSRAAGAPAWLTAAPAALVGLFLLSLSCSLLDRKGGRH